MAGFSYDPQIQYRGDAYTAQAGQALASDISNMFAQHHAQKLQDQLDQANAAKAKVTMDFLAKQPDPNNPQQTGVSLEDMAAFHDAAANGNYTKATKIAEGAAANFATSVALQHQAYQQNPQLRYVPAPQGAPQGTQGRLIRTGEGTDITQFNPSTGVIPSQTQNGVTVPAMPYVQTSQGQVQALNPKPVPANANKTVRMPNGQLVTYGPTGEPHPLAATDNEFKALMQERTKSEAGVLDDAAKYGLTLQDVGKIAQDPKGVSYIAATDKIVNKDGSAVPVTRPFKNKDGAITQIQVQPGEALSSEDAGALVQTYGPGSVRATGKVGDKQFNMPFQNLISATNKYQSLPPKPLKQGVGSEEPSVYVADPNGKPGFIPQSKLKAALEAGFKEL